MLDHNNINKFITTQHFNRLTAENCTVTLKQANLGIKADADNLVEVTDFDDKLKQLNKKVT